MSVTDEFLAHNERYAEGFSGPLPLPPSRSVAVVACMDARLDVYRLLGLQEGEAHVIRNAGGVVTDDVIRSLTISQRLLGTREIILVHHTDCGMLTFSDDDSRRRSTPTPGSSRRGRRRPSTTWRPTCGSASRRIRTSQFIPSTDAVRGFVFDVATGRLTEVTTD